MYSKGGVPSFYLGQLLFLRGTLQQNDNQWKAHGTYLTLFTASLTESNVQSPFLLQDIVFFVRLGGRMWGSRVGLGAWSHPAALRV
jgi:hypothetical protein